MPCTFSEIQDELLTGEVSLNLMEYHFEGDDHKPRTEQEEAAREHRMEKMKTFRRRLAGKAVVGGESENRAAPVIKVTNSEQVITCYCLLFVYLWMLYIIHPLFFINRKPVNNQEVLSM